MATILDPLQQLQVSEQNRLPVALLADRGVPTATTETITLKVFTTSYANDTGSAIGTIAEAVLAHGVISDLRNTTVGMYGDTSFSITSGPASRQKPFPYTQVERANTTGYSDLDVIQARFTAVSEALNVPGDYCVDHENGIVYVNKSSTATTLGVSYSYFPTASGGGGGGAVTTVADNNAIGAFNVVQKLPATDVNSLTNTTNLQSLAVSTSIPTISLHSASCNLFTFAIHNQTGASVYVVFYDTATAPTIGTTTVKKAFGPIANSSGLYLETSDLTETGMFFANGIGIALVTSVLASAAAVSTTGTPAYRINYALK